MQQIKSNFLKHNKNNIVCFIILLLIFILCITGLILLYSAANGSIKKWAIKHFYIILTLIPIIIIIRRINILLFFNFAYHIYFFSLILLIIVKFVGHHSMGAQRWIKIGIINFQPSEFIKLAIIIILARYFHKIKSTKITYLKSLLPAIILTILPIFFIIKQPNLGTTMIILIIVTNIFFVSGVRITFFIIPIVIMFLSFPIIWYLLLHDYQKKRIIIFIKPKSDLLGAGYNITQSKIAIGSGGLYGKGILKGTQNQLSFLPEKHTDFIFTLLAEEFGFLGCFFILSIYAVLILLCYYIAFFVKHHFGRVIICGIITMLFSHIFINISMVSGLLPVVGIPLPL